MSDEYRALVAEWCRGMELWWQYGNQDALMKLYTDLQSERRKLDEEENDVFRNYMVIMREALL